MDLNVDVDLNVVLDADVVAVVLLDAPVLDGSELSEAASPILPGFINHRVVHEHDSDYVSV